MSDRVGIEAVLRDCGFSNNYIQRAFKVYIKNYGHGYNVEVLTEIIIRLQNKDRQKYGTEYYLNQAVSEIGWEWTNYQSEGNNAFYACIALEIFGENTKEHQMTIRNSVHDYILSNSVNEKYFKERYVNGCSSDNIPPSPFFDAVVQNQKQDNVQVSLVDMLAVSEIYNVRIIVHEFKSTLPKGQYAYKPKIEPSIRSYVSCSNIPLILLVTGKTKKGRHLTPPIWGVIHQKHDIGHLISPNMELNEYPDVIASLHSTDLIVRNTANQWIRKVFKEKQQSVVFIPEDICDLIIKLFPQINARPLCLPEQRVYEDVLGWNEQMKNQRNTIVSYCK